MPASNPAQMREQPGPSRPDDQPDAPDPLEALIDHTHTLEERYIPIPYQGMPLDDYISRIRDRAAGLILVEVYPPYPEDDEVVIRGWRPKTPAEIAEEHRRRESARKARETRLKTYREKEIAQLHDLAAKHGYQIVKGADHE